MNNSAKIFTDEYDPFNNQLLWLSLNSKLYRQSTYKTTQYIHKFKAFIDGFRHAYLAFSDGLLIEILTIPPVNVTFKLVIFDNIFKEGIEIIIPLHTNSTINEISVYNEEELGLCQYFFVQTINQITCYQIIHKLAANYKNIIKNKKIILTQNKFVLCYCNSYKFTDELIRDFCCRTNKSLYIYVLTNDKIYEYKNEQLHKEHILSISSTSEKQIYINSICCSRIDHNIVYLGGKYIYQYSLKSQKLNKCIVNEFKTKTNDYSISHLRQFPFQPEYIAAISAYNKTLEIYDISDKPFYKVHSVALPEKNYNFWFYKSFHLYTSNQMNLIEYYKLNLNSYEFKDSIDLNFVLKAPFNMTEFFKVHFIIVKLELSTVYKLLEKQTFDSHKGNEVQIKANTTIFNNICLYNCSSSSNIFHENSNYHYIKGDIVSTHLRDKLFSIYMKSQIYSVSCNLEFLYNVYLSHIKNKYISAKQDHAIYINKAKLVKKISAYFASINYKQSSFVTFKPNMLGLLDAIQIYDDNIGKDFPKELYDHVISIPRPLCACGLYDYESNMLLPAKFDTKEFVFDNYDIPISNKNSVYLISTKRLNFADAKAIELDNKAYTSAFMKYNNCARVPNICIYSGNSSSLINQYQKALENINYECGENELPRKKHNRSYTRKVQAVDVDQQMIDILESKWIIDSSRLLRTDLNYVPMFVTMRTDLKKNVKFT